MKARDNIIIYVDADGTPVSHYSGDSMKNKTKIEIKIGKEIPKGLVSYFLQYNRDYLDMATATKEEIESIKPSEPIVKPTKYTLESLTKLINSFGKKKTDAINELQTILEKEFDYKSKSKRIHYLQNKILILQERKKRGG